MASSDSTLRRATPLIVMALWIAVVAGAMWQHAARSTQPPIYDAATYFLKAQNFWKSVSEGKLVNPLNVEPTFRPPGTVLMSYPLGFDTDYRGFYFRSIFLPVLLVAIAVLVAGYRRDLDTRSRWLLVFLAAFFCTLPGLYYFETARNFPAPSHWGLVDNFLGGVAALATAAMIRSFWTRSDGWLVMAALLGSLCLFIKPSGAFVMALIGLVWLALSLLRLTLAWQAAPERKAAIVSGIKGALIFGVTYLASLAAAFSSRYFSAENLAFGRGALAIKQVEEPIVWSVIQELTRQTIGYPLIAWLLVSALLLGILLWRLPRDGSSWTKPAFVVLTIAAGLTFIFGLWFWIFGSAGIYQVRYCMPFVLMATILAVPAIVQVAPRMHRWVFVAFSLSMAAAVVNVDLLLVQPDAPIAWQKWTGVNMSSAGRDPIIRQASELVERVKRERRDASVYSMPMNFTDAQFQSVIAYSRTVTPSMPLIWVRIPGDLIRPTTYRGSDMLDSDYWLFEPVRDEALTKTILATKSIDTLDQEKILFQAWAAQLTAKDGVDVVSDSPVARILRITDTSRLEAALQSLIGAHRWRDTFTQANPKKRFTDEDVAELFARSPPALENIRFADLIELRALSVWREESDTTIRLWWRPLSTLPGDDWVLFAHWIDDTGKMVGANYLPLNSRAARSDRSTAWLDTITFKNPPPAALRLAVGFVRPNQTPLVADKGERDWGGMRVIVPRP